MNKLLSIMLCIAFQSAWAQKDSGVELQTARNESNRWAVSKQTSGKQECDVLPAEIATRLGLIKQMLATGKPHAALAYLDDMEITVPQARLLRAEALGKSGRDVPAKQLYQTLLNSCMAGGAYQGLGQLEFKSGNYRAAVDYLAKASTALSIDAMVRNDYGYALLMAGEEEAAMHEFLTAIELAPANSLAARNLLLLLAKQGNRDQAEKLALQFEISPQELETIWSSAK